MNTLQLLQNCLFTKGINKIRWLKGNTPSYNPVTKVTKSDPRRLVGHFGGPSSHFLCLIHLSWIVVGLFNSNPASNLLMFGFWIVCSHPWYRKARELQKFRLMDPQHVANHDLATGFVYRLCRYLYCLVQSAPAEHLRGL